MTLAWTNEQLEAIKARGSNILISAGAGSGKTSVLAARVIDLMQSGISIDSLIILTFTNAAAAEMKAKIKSEILKVDVLKDQLSKLENAQISTFDSFCLGLVKQYHYLLNLPANIEIADKVLFSSIKKRLLDETMDHFYQLNESWFNSVIDQYYDKGDSAFKEALLTLDLGLVMIPYAEEYLADLPKSMFEDETINHHILTYEKRKMDQLQSLQQSIQSVFQEFIASSNDKTIFFAHQMQELYHALLQAKSLDDLLKIPALIHPSLPRKSKAIDEETVAWMRSLFVPIKKQIGQLFKETLALFAPSTLELKSAMLETKSAVFAVVEVLKEYRRRIRAYQFKEHLFDFSDIMHLAIELLRNHPDIAQELRDKTSEIMVDEYQDTNDLQEYLVSLFSRNNVFMVGDAKQSIYGFRDANPENFIKKYHDYSQHIGGKAINLSYNFRSRKEVLQGINQLFIPVMDETLGGVNYQDNQSLLYGNDKYDALPPKPFSYEPQIISYTIPEESTDSTAMMEGKIIAETILNLIETQTSVLNIKNAPTYSHATYKDFCILVDRKSDFEVYESVLTAYGIPCEAISDESFIASTEILTVHQLLRLVKCYLDPEYFLRNFKQAFYGLARSFIYQIPDDDIIQFLMKHQGLSQDTLSILSSIPAIKSMHEQILFLSKSVQTKTIKEWIKELVKTTKIYECIAKLENPANVERKLDFLFAKVSDFRRFSFDDLIQYFDDVYQAKDLDIEYAKMVNPEVNAVKLMTMHKSKGLEFPFCFYPGLHKKFNTQDMNQFVLFDSHYGLVLKAFDQGFKSTVWHELIKQDRLQKLISERIRLFYVALTRAKEKIYLLYNAEPESDVEYLLDDSGYLPTKVRLEYRHYRKMMESVSIAKTWMHPFVSKEPNSFQKQEEDDSSANINIHYETRKIEPVFKQKSSYSKTLTFDFGQTKSSLVETGLKWHDVFEHIDFKNINKSLLSLDHPYKDAILRFIAHSELKNIHQADIRQEYPFMTLDEPPKMGVIDLMLIYDDHVDIIDYKLKNLSDSAYIDQLKGYKMVISPIINKPIYLYLYSILDDVLTPIGENHEPISIR